MNKKGKHTSVEKELRRAVQWLENLAVVDRVVLCPFEPARHHCTPGMVKYQRPSRGGVILKAYGGNGIMNLFVKIPEQHRNQFLSLLQNKYE